MKRFKKTLRTLAVGMSTLSSAQAAVNVQLFNPSSGSKYMLTENAMPDKPDGEPAYRYRRYMLGVNYSYLHDPLVQLNEARTARVATLIEGIQTMDLNAGFDYSGYFSVNVGLPMHLVHRPATGAAFTLGDMRLYSKIHVWRGQLPFDMVFIPEVILPTGSQDLFVSNGSTALGFHVGFEYDFGVLSASANAGFRHVINGGQFDAMNYQNQIPLKLGISVPIGPRFAVNGEGQGILMVPWDRFQAPSEFYLGARYKITDDMVASAGASVGSFNGIASSDWRILAGLKFAPTSKDYIAKVAKAEPKPLPRVEFTAKAVIIREEVRFEHNSDVLTASGKNLLDEVAKVLKENRAGFSSIVIEGHTNEIGSQKYNLVLSRKRANSVKEYLVSRGIEREVLNPMGFGKSRPKAVAKELSKTARLEINRRVEFKVVAPTQTAGKKNGKGVRSAQVPSTTVKKSG